MADPLTTQAYWDSTWAGMTLPRRRNPHSYSLKLAEAQFKKYLPKNDANFLEIGCAPATWMVYFAERFRYKVSGIDYAPLGVELAIKNLKLCKIDGTVLAQDLFNNTLPKAAYDVVFSWGFIEHFDDPTEAVHHHVELIKPGGYLVLCVPNMDGLPGLMQRMLNADVYRAHRHLGEKDLALLVKKFKLQKKFCGYIGSFAVDNLNPGRSGKLGKKKYSLEKYQLAAVRTISGLWKILPHWEWRYSSPYVLVIAKKPLK